MLNNQEIKMPVLIEDLGQMFTTVSSKRKRRFGLYKCACGNEFKVTTQSIKDGNTKSCGCYQKALASNMVLKRCTTHGLRNHRLYNIWNNMNSRCYSIKNIFYKNYGDIGIKVCERWLNVANFIEDMYPSFIEGLTIDRRNNDLGCFQTPLEAAIAYDKYVVDNGLEHTLNNV